MAQRSGLLMGTRQFTGWSLGMYDFDNDGWKDLFFALSHFRNWIAISGAIRALPNRVFRNLEGKRFEDVSAGGRARLSTGRHASRRGVRRFRQRRPGRCRGLRGERSGEAVSQHHEPAKRIGWRSAARQAMRIGRGSAPW